MFHAGPSTAMHFIDTRGDGKYTNAGTRPGNDAMNGNAVMVCITICAARTV